MYPAKNSLKSHSGKKWGGGEKYAKYPIYIYIYISVKQGKNMYYMGRGCNT